MHSIKTNPLRTSAIGQSNYLQMRNFTEYHTTFILNLIEQSGGNPRKCTANIQYAVEFNRLVPVLVIYQDYSRDWDYDDRCIYCEKTAALNFCEDWHINTADLDAMLEYYNKIAFQKAVNDIEYEIERDTYYVELMWDYYETLRDAMPNCFD